MKKKIIAALICIIIVGVGILSTMFLNNFNKHSNIIPISQYTPFKVTHDSDINEKMEQMTDIIGNNIAFEPQISHSISSSEIKLVADSVEDAENNSSQLNGVINKAKNGTLINIPSGTYYLDSTINILGKKNITISAEGNGALFINSAYSPFNTTNYKQTPNVFNIFSCKNIRIQNISFDYLNYVSAEGTIISHADGNTHFKLYDEYVKGEKTALSGGEIITSVFTANENGFTEERWFDTALKLEKKTEQVFYIPTKIGQVSEKITCRFTVKGPYISYVINVAQTNGLILENLNCYSCPGGFILAVNDNANLYFKDINVGVKEGSQRLLGSNEDCLHIRDVTGTLTLLDSSFYGIGDDALNIHSQLVEARCDEQNSAVITTQGATTKFFVKKGETVEFFDNNYNSLGVATVEKVKSNSIIFDQIPKSENIYYMQNVSRSPDTVVSNCEIGFARARGVLIQSKNCVIQKCNFKNIRLSAILAAPDFEYWHEGGFCDNLLIENNSFENCAWLNNGMGVINISTSHDGAEGNKLCTHGHKNVSILNNTFNYCISQKIKTFSVINLKQEEN